MGIDLDAGHAPESFQRVRALYLREGSISAVKSLEPPQCDKELTACGTGIAGCERHSHGAERKRRIVDLGRNCPAVGSSSGAVSERAAARNRKFALDAV